MSFTKILAVTSFICLNVFAINVFAKAGGVSGGGGFVINPLRPTQPQSAQDIEQIIKNSKSIVSKYIQTKKMQLKQNTMSGHEQRIYDQLLNSQKNNLEDVVKKYNVHIEDEAPCYTSDHIAVDGSIFAETANSICISSATIAEKVHPSEVSKQAAALMLHEMIEVAGLEDADAIHLQKIALDEIK